MSTDNLSEMADKRQKTGTTRETIIVGPDGDLRIALDAGTLQVLRKTLTLSSPVCLAMFGRDNRFIEPTNKTLDPEGVQTIAFPDDNDRGCLYHPSSVSDLSALFFPLRKTYFGSNAIKLPTLHKPCSAKWKRWL